MCGRQEKTRLAVTLRSRLAGLSHVGDPTLWSVDWVVVTAGIAGTRAEHPR